MELFGLEPPKKLVSIFEQKADTIKVLDQFVQVELIKVPREIFAPPVF